MKANELRIGNLVYVSDNQTNLIFKEITPINIHNLMHLTGWDKSPVDIEFEPIPLTEEFLLKFKWQLIKEETFYINSYFNLDKVGHLYYRNEYVGIYINYVHQLQNLYFALTGEELTFKSE